MLGNLVEECDGAVGAKAVDTKAVGAGDGAGWGIVRVERGSSVLFVEEERMNEYEVG